jgi:hypothetical protein
LWNVVWRIALSAGELVLIWLLLIVAADILVGDNPMTMGGILVSPKPWTLGVLLVVGVCFYGLIWTLVWIWTPYMHPKRTQDEVA